jgi:hypothetical protein
MHPELAAYHESIQNHLRQIIVCVNDLNASQLNWRPPVGRANSAYVLVEHTLGNARAWILGIACGQPVARDRPAEFHASGQDIEPLIEEWKQLSQDIEVALAAIPPSKLEERLVPDQSLVGEGESREMSVRDAILQVIEHASLHLGHPQLTRDLALQAQVSGMTSIKELRHGSGTLQRHRR